MFQLYISFLEIILNSCNTHKALGQTSSEFPSCDELYTFLSMTEKMRVQLVIDANLNYSVILVSQSLFLSNLPTYLRKMWRIAILFMSLCLYIIIHIKKHNDKCVHAS